MPAQPHNPRLVGVNKAFCSRHLQLKEDQTAYLDLELDAQCAN